MRKVSHTKHIQQLLKILHKAYPDAQCALLHRNAFELLVATVLSAQCTDVRVNMVTPALFARFPTPAALAAAPPEEIETYIASINFFRNKARALVGIGTLLTTQYQGQVPQRMRDLILLPGVARKTANVVLGVAFGLAEGIVVDTHVLRLSQRLGLSQESTPLKVEQDLLQQVPKSEWIHISHLLILHGRAVCQARKQHCDICVLQHLCPSAFGQVAQVKKRRPSTKPSRRARSDSP